MWLTLSTEQDNAVDVDINPAELDLDNPAHVAQLVQAVKDAVAEAKKQDADTE